MNLTQFWELIDKTRAAADGDSQKQSDLLVEELARLPVAQMFEFEDMFRDLLNRSYVAELWDAAFVINCGCGDDGFSEFREWLVGRGKGVFEKAVADPESLVDVIEVGSKNMYPTLLGVVDKAYERATGQKSPPRFWDSAPLRGELVGEPANLALFPKLKANYWDWWVEQFTGKHE